MKVVGSDLYGADAAEKCGGKGGKVAGVTGMERRAGSRTAEAFAERVASAAPGECGVECGYGSRVPVVVLNLADEMALPWLPPEAGDERPGKDNEAIARLLKRARRDAKTGCLVWTGGRYAKSAYGAIVYRQGKYRAHRLAWIAHNGPIPNGLYVCHACDNPACIAIEHLFLGTPKDNMTDMRIKGRGRFRSRLTVEEVARVKRLLAEGMAMAEVARETGVAYASVFAIKSGKNWRGV